MTIPTNQVTAVLDRLDTACADSEETLLIACRYCADNHEVEGALETMARARRESRRELRPRCGTSATLRATA